MSMYGAVERFADWMVRIRGFRERRIATTQGTVRTIVRAGDPALPPVVMLHGVTSIAAEWAPVFARLRGPVIAVDLPGHGRSDVPADGMRARAIDVMLREALDALIVTPAVVFGNSLGGLAALRYAVARPERVCGLILNSPGGARMTDDELRAYLAGFPTDLASARTFVDRLYHRVPWYAPMIARYVRHRFGRPPIRELLASISTADLATPAELGAVTMRALMIWGKADRIQTPPLLAFFREHLPEHVELVEPATFAHCPNLEQPAEIAELIAEFAYRGPA